MAPAPALTSLERPPKRRGRPPGARSKVLADGRGLGPHHIAFLRAWFEGVDLRKAWDRYLAFAVDSSDARVIESTRVALLRAVLAAGHQADRSHPELKLKRALDLITQEPFTKATAPIPSLDDWIASEGIDPDFSEAELLELYREHYGLDGVADEESASGPGAAGAPEKPDSLDQVRALNQVAAVISRAPSPADRVALWLSPKLASALQRAGAATLSNLVDLINLYGYRWYTRVDGLGERRARTVNGWLSELVKAPGSAFEQPLRESALSPPQQQAAWRKVLARDVVDPPQFGLVPLERLRVPPALQGRDGIYRSLKPNTLGADDDFSAIQAWLSRYERVHTRRAYRKEIERFYLWCLMVARKPLSSVHSPDCQAYRRFLADVPADWIQSRVVAKNDPAWRPFRGPSMPSSQKQALVIVQTMFEGLQQAGYLVANPMAAVMKGFDLPASHIQTARSLSAAQADYLLSHVRSQPAGPHQRRDLLMLTLLMSTGARLDEVAGASVADLERVDVDGEEDSSWVLGVVGKRRKRRVIPVADDVVELVRQHHQDQAELGVTMPPRPALLGSLAPAPPQWRPAADGTVQVAPISSAMSQRLSHSGIYRALKRLFRRAAQTAALHGIDGEHLEAASTHWLRHTFGRQAIAAGVEADVVQQALGHESLATTSIYITSERSRLIKSLRRMRERAQDAT